MKIPMTPYERLVLAAHRQRVAADELDAAVRAARAAGHSWEDLAGPVGITRQGLAKRYGGRS